VTAKSAAKAGTARRRHALEARREQPLKIDLDGLMQRVDRMPVIAANITQIDAVTIGCST